MANTKDNSKGLNKSDASMDEVLSKQTSEGRKDSDEKGPLSFFLGALTSILFGWISLLLSEKVVIYFTTHSLEYSSQIAQSIASGFKTLIIGISFLATFTFFFIGIGLSIVFIRSFFGVKRVEDD